MYVTWRWWGYYRNKYQSTHGYIITHIHTGLGLFSFFFWDKCLHCCRRRDRLRSTQRNFLSWARGKEYLRKLRWDLCAFNKSSTITYDVPCKRYHSIGVGMIRYLLIVCGFILILYSSTSDHQEATLAPEGNRLVDIGLKLRHLIPLFLLAIPMCGDSIPSYTRKECAGFAILEEKASGAVWIERISFRGSICWFLKRWTDDSYHTVYLLIHHQYLGLTPSTIFIN